VEDLGRRTKIPVEADEYFHNNIFRKYWVKLGGSTA
jgi:hypothetical protein